MQPVAVRMIGASGGAAGKAGRPPRCAFGDASRAACRHRNPSARRNGGRQSPPQERTTFASAAALGLLRAAREAARRPHRGCDLAAGRPHRGCSRPCGVRRRYKVEHATDSSPASIESATRWTGLAFLALAAASLYRRQLTHSAGDSRRPRRPAHPRRPVRRPRRLGRGGGCAAAGESATAGGIRGPRRVGGDREIRGDRGIRGRCARVVGRGEGIGSTHCSVRRVRPPATEAAIAEVGARIARRARVARDGRRSDRRESDDARVDGAQHGAWNRAE